MEGAFGDSMSQAQQDMVVVNGVELWRSLTEPSSFCKRSHKTSSDCLQPGMGFCLAVSSNTILRCLDTSGSWNCLGWKSL